MTTVHIVQRMAPGGIETLVLDLALADCNIYVLSLEGKTEQLIADWPRLERIQTRLFALNKPNRLVFSLINTLSNHLKCLGAKSIITHHIGPLLYAGLAARLRFINVRVHVEHDAWHYQNAHRRRIAKLLYAWVNPRLVAVSKSTAVAVREALNVDDFEIIPNGVDMNRFKPASKIVAREALNLPQGKQIIGSIGRLVHVKGHDLLIEALANLPPTIDLALVGHGDERINLERQAKQLNIADRVHFLGNLNAPELAYPAFDVFCLPSRGEGFPRTLIEAQACDVSVVATDVGGSSEALCPLTGHLVEANNAIKLAQILEFALNNPNSTSPRHFVNPKFSFERTIEAYRQICQ